MMNGFFTKHLGESELTGAMAQLPWPLSLRHNQFEANELVAAADVE